MKSSNKNRTDAVQKLRRSNAAVPSHRVRKARTRSGAKRVALAREVRSHGDLRV